MPFPEPARFSIKDLARRWGIAEEDVCEQIRAGHFKKLIVYTPQGGGYTHRYTISPITPPSTLGHVMFPSPGTSISSEDPYKVWVGYIHSMLDFPWPKDESTLYIPRAEVKTFEKIHGISPVQDATSPTTARAPLNPFPTPPGTTWYHVSIRFTSNEAAKVSAGKCTQTLTFAEMGFKDHRKGDRPNSLWGMLKDGFGQHKGEIDWDTHLGDKDMGKLKTMVKELRKRLKAFFGIQDDPFEPYRRVKAYKTKFTVQDLTQF